MQYVSVNQSCTVTFRFPESASGNTVTYTIYKSDGTTFASGSATFVAGSFWKVTFTPSTVNEIYSVELYNSTLDSRVGDSLKAVLDQPVATDQTTATTAAELLTKVEAAISSRLNGGGVTSYRTQDGRNVQYMTLDELRLLRNDLKSEIAASKTAKQTTTHVRFHRPL